MRPRIDPRFLLHALSHKRPQLERLAGQTTQANISGAILRAFRLPVPDDPRDQSRIATILDSIDAAIEKTEAVIEATERLISDIIEGLESTATEHAPIGALVSAILDHRGRTPLKLGGDWSTDGVLVISARNIQKGQLVIDAETRRITPAMYRAWMREPLAAGDILVTSEAPLGSVARVPAGGEFCLGQRLFGVRADDRAIVPDYLFFALTCSSVQRQMEARGTGTTARGIRQTELRKVEVPVCDRRGQLRVSAALASLDERGRREQRVLAELRSLKTAAAAELLSGRLQSSCVAGVAG